MYIQFDIIFKKMPKACLMAFFEETVGILDKFCLSNLCDLFIYVIEN